MPTPTAERDGNTPETHLARKPGRKVVTSLDVVAAHVLPTPVVNDMGDGKTPEWWADFTERSKANTGNGNGHGKSLAMEAIVLPTPSRQNGERRGGQDPDERRAGGHQVNLVDAALSQDWREYEPAIRRQEHAFGRPAPLPTEPGRTGKPRLSARFSEWLMGCPDGWITDVPGITRNEALKAAGNGVVPQQCAAAAMRFVADYARMQEAAA